MAAEKFGRLKAPTFGSVLIFVLFAVFHGGCVSSQKNAVPQAVASTPAPSSTETTADGYSVQVSPAQVPDGSIVLIDVSFQRPFAGKLTATFEDKTFSLYPLGEASAGVTHFQGEFGVPHNHKPGNAAVTVSVEGKAPSSASFMVVDGNYKSEVLKVAARKVNPLKKDMVRIKRELAEIGEIYKLETPNKYWDGPFQLPLHSFITDPFGTKRLYNGQLTNYHGGLDFRAAIGTPIYSAGAGKVVLAKDLFYSGNTVIIDHGYGLLTMYFHMSKLEVKKGQTVSSHQLLGLSGKTGRVTGPHLHWQAVIHQVKVNPMGLVEELK